MPLDATGKEIHMGDVLVLRGEVKAIVNEHTVKILHVGETSKTLEVESTMFELEDKRGPLAAETFTVGDRSIRKEYLSNG